MVRPDTIVALATPPGISALAVVRLSGPEAFSMVGRLCPRLPTPLPPRRPTLGWAVDPRTGERLDQVMVTAYPAPKSYTGEDVVELSCHGGWLSPQLVVEALLELGGRRAQEGEFTRRAYLNGKLDLLQAEAVLDLIEGRSLALHGRAVHHLERGLSRRLAQVREDLLGLEASLVYHLDFPEEDEPPVPLTEIVAQAKGLEGLLEALAKTAPEGELLREGALVVLAGPPNSGKSSLFNALLGEERAIVTEIPGTTRDALEATVSWGGYPFRLVDTAGLRKSQEVVEQMGIEVAWRYLVRAQAVLLCVEGGVDPEPFLRELRERSGEARLILVRTKRDLWEAGSVPSHGEGPADTGGLPMVPISAHTGEGLAELREILLGLVFGEIRAVAPEFPVLTRRRQAEGVQRALEDLRAFRRALEEGVPPEAATAHLRSAETALEELLGVIPREEVLDRLFRQFCIGK